MARIAGIDIPRDKRVVVSLTYVYGIGRPLAEKILETTQISEDNGYMGIIKDTEGNRIGLHSNPLT